MKRKILIFSGVLLLAIPFFVVADGRDEADSVNKGPNEKTMIQENEDQSITYENSDQPTAHENKNPENFQEDDNQSLIGESTEPSEEMPRFPNGEYNLERPCMANGAFRGGHGRHHFRGYVPSNQQHAVHTDMLNYVKKYLPERLAEWEAVLEERNELREQWFANRSPMNRNEWRGYGRGQRHHMNQVGLDSPTEDNYDGLYNDERMFCQDVYDAVRSGDKEMIMKQLNNMLDHLKERNDDFRERLQQTNR